MSRRAWFRLCCLLPILAVFAFALYAVGKLQDIRAWSVCLLVAGVFYLMLVFATLPAGSRINTALERYGKRDVEVWLGLSESLKGAILLLIGIACYLLYRAGTGIFDVLLIACLIRGAVVAIVMLFNAAKGQKGKFGEPS